MKILLGILIGLGLSASIAYASSTFWASPQGLGKVERFQDGDINCYVLSSGGLFAPKSISCINWKTVIQK